jgi:HD-like signal output (HDOD) protein
MPEELVHAVAWHHDPDQCQENCRLSDLVHVANIAARSIDGGSNGNGLAVEASLKTVDRLGLRPGDITTLAEETRQELGKLKEILND